MIKLKELENRVYRDKMCVTFYYTIKGTEQNDNVTAKFELISDCEWRMQIIFERTRDADSQVYNFGYVMPRAGLPLELIAATGLKYFQLYLKDEIQTKMNIDMVLGGILEGI